MRVVLIVSSEKPQESGHGGGRSIRVRPGSPSRYARLAGPGSNAGCAAPGRVFARARKLARRTKRPSDPASPSRATATTSGRSSQSLRQMRRATDRRAFAAAISVPSLLADQSLRRGPRGELGVVFRRACFRASRNTTPNSPQPPPQKRCSANSARAAKILRGEPNPGHSTGAAADQAESAALMRALTAPMSARPAAFAFTAAITLPMSLTEAAPVAAMASRTMASTSASESWEGR